MSVLGSAAPPSTKHDLLAGVDEWAGASCPRPLGESYRATPTSTGSFTSSMPNFPATPALICRASRIRLAVLAPPGLVSASVCFLDSRASPGSADRANPLLKPACSISHAAETLTWPSGSGQCGMVTAPPASAVTLAARSSYRAAPITGLVKNEPALRVSGSAGSSTMPLPRRSASTALRASASGTRSPSGTSSSRLSSPYLTGADSGLCTRRNVTLSTTNRPVAAAGFRLAPRPGLACRLNTLVR